MNSTIHFDSSGVKKLKLKNSLEKNSITNICRIQACDSIMCGYVFIRSIDFMLKGKSLLDYTNLFSPNYYDKMI